MEESLRQLLLDSSAVAALCGDRIDWGSRPQGSSLPAIVLNVVAEAEDHDLEGPDGLSQGRVQVDCYGQTYDRTKRLARAVRGVLDGHRDEEFQGIFHQSSADGREGGANEVERPFRVRSDYLTNWSENNA